MTNTKKEYKSLDVAPSTVYGLSDPDGEVAIPILGYAALKLDDTTTANVTYVGKAKIGCAGSAALWQIMKIDETTGLVITWADGNVNFDNVWDNRASLSYS